jgi:uncharacterized membrane protein
MTIDDQLETLRPLTPGVAAKLAGYSNPQSIRVQRQRGRPMSPERLRAMAVRLRELAGAAEELAG